MVAKQLLPFLLAILLSSVTGCQTIPIEEPMISTVALVDQLETLTPPVRKVTVAVYSFGDLTGQRKPSENLALLSTAVTQGASVWLVQALKRAGGGDTDFSARRSSF